MTAADPLAELHQDGFVVLRDVLSASEVDALRAALQPYLDLSYRRTAAPR